MLYGGDWGSQFQEDWRWCRHCRVLFYSPGLFSGVCPYNGGYHDGSSSDVYSILVRAGQSIFLSHNYNQLS